MKQFKVIICIILMIYAEAFTLTDVDAAKRRDKRIVGGTRVSAYGYQFFLSLHYKSNSRHFCGATRVAEKWAITAAHCVTLGPTNVYLVTFDNRTILIDKILQKYFESKYLGNDIAMLKLRDRSNVAVYGAVLPASLINPHENCIILVDEASSYYGIRSGYLKRDHVEVITLEECQSKFRSGLAPKENTGMLCAGRGSAWLDDCNGDAGGPVICGDGDGQYELTGIISYSSRTGDIVVFTSTYHYLEWINDITF